MRCCFGALITGRLMELGYGVRCSFGTLMTGSVLSQTSLCLTCLWRPHQTTLNCHKSSRPFYFIRQVVVESCATKEEVVVASLSEGNYFGEISLLRLDGGRNRRVV